MKTIADGFLVSERSYYYLLDWNESDNWEYIMREFGTTKLKDLNRVAYKRLFNKATIAELNNW